MPTNTPISYSIIKQFKNAAHGKKGSEAEQAIVKAVLSYFGDKEITVLDPTETQELFRIGPGGRHGIQGIHVHQPYVKHDPVKGPGMGKLGVGATAVPLEASEQDWMGPNYYIGKLLKALQKGWYRFRGG